jgi:hypothetical protein
MLQQHAITTRKQNSTLVSMQNYTKTLATAKLDPKSFNTTTKHSIQQ